MITKRYLANSYRYTNRESEILREISDSSMNSKYVHIFQRKSKAALHTPYRTKHNWYVMDLM